MDIWTMPSPPPRPKSRDLIHAQQQCTGATQSETREASAPCASPPRQLPPRDLSPHGCHMPKPTPALLEALAVHDRRARLVVLLLAKPTPALLEALAVHDRR